jgi:hypothetical protein
MGTAMKLKTWEDIDIDTSTFIGILQQAGQAATPTQHPFNTVSNLPSVIKRLVAIKRRARSKWQKPMSQATDAYLITQATS